MRIVVTGFEPFGGRERNESWEAVKTLTGVERVLLPVSFSRSGEAVRRIATSRPDAVICVGEAGGRSAVSVERLAVNLMDARMPDNDGWQPRDVPIRKDGPAAYFSTLPTRPILENMQEAGIPAEISYTAGTYVCNGVFYALMDALAQTGAGTAGGFIHVPTKGMTQEQIAQALRIAVERAAMR